MNVEVNAITYAHKICGECGVTFMIPLALDDECKKRPRELGWHCPNGHRRGYVKSTADILREDKERLASQLAKLTDEKAKLQAIIDKMPPQPKRKRRKP